MLRWYGSPSVEKVGGSLETARESRQIPLDGPDKARPVVIGHDGPVSDFLVTHLDSIDERLLDYLDEEDEDAIWHRADKMPVRARPRWTVRPPNSVPVSPLSPVNDGEYLKTRICPSGASDTRAVESFVVTRQLRFGDQR